MFDPTICIDYRKIISSQFSVQVKRRKTRFMINRPHTILRNPHLKGARSMNQGEVYPPSFWRARPPSGKQGTGLFERKHLSDQFSSALYRGPSPGLHCIGLMVFINFCYSRPAARAACSVGVDADLRRVPCRASKYTVGPRRPWKPAIFRMELFAKAAKVDKNECFR